MRLSCGRWLREGYCSDGIELDIKRMENLFEGSGCLVERLVEAIVDNQWNLVGRVHLH